MALRVKKKPMGGGIAFFDLRPKPPSDFAGETSFFQYFCVFFLFLSGQSPRRSHTVALLPPLHVLRAKIKKPPILKILPTFWWRKCPIFEHFLIFAPLYVSGFSVILHTQKRQILTEHFDISVTELGVRGSPLNFHNLGVGFRGGGLSIGASRRSTEATTAKYNL